MIFRTYYKSILSVCLHPKRLDTSLGPFWSFPHDVTAAPPTPGSCEEDALDPYSSLMNLRLKFRIVLEIEQFHYLLDAVIVTVSN